MKPSGHHVLQQTISFKLFMQMIHLLPFSPGELKTLDLGCSRLSPACVYAEFQLFYSLHMLSNTILHAFSVDFTLNPTGFFYLTTVSRCQVSCSEFSPLPCGS